MRKTKKISRKRKKQIKREQVSVHKSEIMPDESATVEESGNHTSRIKSPDETPELVEIRHFLSVKLLPIPKSSSGRRSRWLSLLAAVFICGLAFVIYSNTLSVPFVFDDRINISDNPAIRISQLTIKNLVGAAFESPVPSRPLANISLALNYYFHEYELPGYHIVNIFIHALNGILLYFLFVMTFRTPVLKTTLGNPKIVAFAAAVFWLAHPLQTQSVTYIVQRMNSTATMFYLLAMLLYVTARLASAKRGKIFLFTGCALSGLLGFWFKEILFTLPFFILLYEFYFFQDLDFNWFRSRTFIVLSILVVLGAVIVTTQKLDSLVSGYDLRPFTMGQRLLTESRVVVFYISQLFYPHPSRLNIFHDFPVSLSILQPSTTLFSVMALTALLGLAISIARRHRLLSFCILWYLGNLFIESSVIPLEIIFEHRNYLPSTFLCLMFSCLVIHSLSFIRSKALAPFILLLITMLLCYWTYDRNNDWRNEETLLIDSLEKAPNVARTQASLGYVLMWQWRLDEAMRRFQIALRLNPTIGVKRLIWKNIDFLKKMKKYPRGYKNNSN